MPRMSDKVSIYGFSDNDRSGKVRWTACELGLEIDEHRVARGEHRKAPYRELNPYAHVPTAVFRDEVLIESTAACHYLAEQFREPKLWIGPGEPKRKEMLFWCSLFAETLEGRLVECVLSKSGILAPDYFPLHEPGLRFKLAVVADRLPERDYLCGSQFTVADVLAGYSLRLALAVGLVDRDKVMPYVDRLRGRAAAEQSRIFSSLQ